MSHFKPTLRLLSQASKARAPRPRPTPPPGSASASPPSSSSPSGEPAPSHPSTISHPDIQSHPKPWTRPEPPLVERARQKSVKQRNVWESYLVLDPKTRLYFSLGLMAFAALGLYLGDELVPESEEEKQAREAKEGAKAISVSSS